MCVKHTILLSVSPTCKNPAHTQCPVGTHDAHLCYADGLGPHLTLSWLPLRGGRWRVNLFTTSALGSGDELRLAQCPPRAGPGLSHRGQMTVEAKWVPSCSPRELPATPPFPPNGGPPFQSSPGQTGGREGLGVQAIAGPSPGQRTTGQIPAQPGPLPEHPSQDHSPPAGVSSFRQHPLRVTCKRPQIHLGNKCNFPKIVLLEIM